MSNALAREVQNMWNDQVDLANCDREEVQFVGAIMPQGILLILSSDDYRILGASANAAASFGLDFGSFAGGSSINC